MKMDLIPLRGVLLAVFLAGSSFSWGGNEAKADIGGDEIEINSIYGIDHRMDYYQSPIEIQKESDGVAVMVRETDVLQNVDALLYDQKTLGEKASVCASDPYANQPSIGSCTGFLISPTLMVTAGHCIKTQADCQTSEFIFGFNMKSRAGLPVLHIQDAYRCQSIVKQELSGSHDYAIVQLNRAVTNHTPLKIAANAPSVGDSVAVMGYPMGLPFKYANGAKVRGYSPDLAFFDTNLDTFGGNSGSPVINAKGEVEGILVRGALDYEFTDNFCRAAVVYPEDGGRGESVSNISLVKAALGMP